MAASGASWFFHDEAIPLPPVVRSKKQMAVRLRWSRGYGRPATARSRRSARGVGRARRRAHGRVQMKRFALSVVMTGMLGLAAHTLWGAQPPSGDPEGHRPRGGPGGGGIAALRGVDLTEEQRAAIKAIGEGEQSAQQGPSNEGRLRRELQAEVFSDAPDLQKTVSLQQQLAESQS